MSPYRTTEATLVAVDPFDIQIGILDAIAELEVPVDDRAVRALGAAVGALPKDVGTAKQRLLVPFLGGVDGLKTTASWSSLGVRVAVDRVAEVTLVVRKDIIRWFATFRDHVCAIWRAVVIINALLWIIFVYTPRAFAFPLCCNIDLANRFITIVDMDVHNKLPAGIALGAEAGQLVVKSMTDIFDLQTSTIGCGWR